MTRSKRILSMVVAMIMCIGLLPMYTMADDTTGFDNFAVQNTFESETFTDITDDKWFYGDVKAVYELGLMRGKGEGTFAPDSSVTLAEAITIAARLNAIYTTGSDEFEVGEVWYDSYVAYAKENGILTFDIENYDAPAKRSEFALIMANALPSEALEAVNAVADGAIPDVAADAAYADAVYALYRAGIMVGNDEAGTFAPDSEIKRSEIAAITARMSDTELRREVTLGEEAADDTTAPEETTVPEETTAPEAETTAPEAEDTTVPEEETTAPEEDEEALKELILSLVGAQLGMEETTAAENTAVEIMGAILTVNGVAAETVNVGDVITFTVEPAEATGLITWTIGGVEILNHENTYTVTSLDLGKTIKAEITGNGSFTGSASDECTVASAVEVNLNDIKNAEAGNAPVVLTSVDKFLDNDGQEVDLADDAALTLTIEEAQASDEEIEDNIEIVANKIMTDNADVNAEDIADLTVTAVNVDLSVDEKVVHPVGAVTVTLSAAQLGLEEGTDLSLYSFTANHTNKDGIEESVAGELVTIDGVQYIRFELNGLSTIWIGNVPPRTVRFYNFEEDADACNDNYIGEVIVKFGDLTPTLQIPTPSREGYIFCGWNYDMTRTPIITNLEVHALWLKGEKMSTDNFSLSLSEESDDLNTEIDNGYIGFDSDEALGLPANLKATVTVTAPNGAVKYAVAENPNAAAEITEYTDITSDTQLGFTFDVTDKDGLLIASTYTHYYKWIDADGEVISIEELKVRISNGSDTATSKVYTADVDRGIGTFEAYFIDSDDETKTYVGYINNNLIGRFDTGYRLNNYVSFDGYRVDQNFSAYDTIKLVFTPFEGEAYSENDTIEAKGEYSTYNKDTDTWTWTDEWNGTCEIKDGKLIVTYPFDVAVMNDDGAEAIISLGDTVQRINMWWDHAEDIYDDDYEDDDYENRVVEIECDTWAEVLEALSTISIDKKQYYITCYDEAAITLSSALTLPANVNLYLARTPSFTVANGGVLTFTDHSGYETSSYMQIRKGYVIVENGGVITSARADDSSHGSRWVPSLRANGLTFKSGSSLTLPEDTFFGIYYYDYYSEEENGICTFEKGSVVNNSGNLRIQNFDTLNLNGTFNSTSYAYIYNDEINIGGSVNFNRSRNGGYLELHGTVNIDATGSLTANNSNEYWSGLLLEIYGPLTNRGTIEIKGGGYAEIMNNGFANYNFGTISIGADCEVYTTGTKFINSGKITGAGTIYAQLGDDYTNYDDGAEWIEVEEDGYWDEELEKYVYKLDNYSRYKYTHDPAKTARALLYRSEIVDSGDGECTVEIIAEDFPEIGDSAE